MNSPLCVAVGLITLSLLYDSVVIITYSKCGVAVRQIILIWISLILSLVV